MSLGTTTTVVGVFNDRDQAHRCIAALHDAGFPDADIGMMSRNVDNYALERAEETTAEQNTETGILAGTVAGAGIGGLIGWGVITGMVPVIGPAIAAGTLGVILSNAAAGGALAGLAGALMGWGISETEAHHYESELHAGRTIVTVNADERAAEARDIMRLFDGLPHDRHA